MGTRFKRRVLIYDGDCASCTRLARAWCQAASIEGIPAAQAPERFSQISPEQAARSALVVRPDGSVASGARAVLEVLAETGRAWPLSLYDRLPGYAHVSEALYRLVARHRGILPRLDFALTPSEGAARRLTWPWVAAAGLALTPLVAKALRRLARRRPRR